MVRGSGVCELTNQSGLGIREGGLFKRPELKQSISNRAGRHCCSTGQYEKTDVGIIACKTFQVVMHNEILYVKISVLCLF